jgi:hypothetical protein
MTLHLEDIAPLSGSRPPNAVPVRRNRLPRDGWRATRRGFLRGSLVAGASVGLTTLGVFPQARKALAEGYDMKSLPCPSYAASHNCSPGCGPSLPSESFCRTASPHAGYHRTGSAGGYNYSLRPNQCYGGWADGWYWEYKARCGGCAGGKRYRCHDGYRSSGSGTTRTICRHRVVCYF